MIRTETGYVTNEHLAVKTKNVHPLAIRFPDEGLLRSPASPSIYSSRIRDHGDKQPNRWIFEQVFASTDIPIEVQGSSD